MKENSLLASVTLFGELYNSESYTNVSDIIADLIKGAIISENQFSFNSNELKGLMSTVYGFDIPESVLRTVLKSKFKEDLTVEHKIYHLDNRIADNFKNFEGEVDEIMKQQNGIINRLYDYIEHKTKSTLNENEKSLVVSSFSNYLLDKDFSEKYADLISAFIVSNESNTAFTESINSVKEGLILYQGINFSGNVSQLGQWNTELSVYLSTEHLFNLAGYNGLLFQEIFEDFFKLVVEINTSAKKKAKGKKLIQLKYLKETKDEIDYFFTTAESIKKGYKRLDPSKLAMSNILKGCENPRDIKNKQINFYSELKSKGIEFQSFNFNLDESEYNVVDESLINELKEISETKGKSFDESYCIQMLRIFTKINSFRGGNNRFPFEKIRHIYITENRFTNYLAHNDKVNFGVYEIPFAKDIDFITSKFWFKLKKGFNNKNELPKSFDFVTKAKIILSSHLNNSLSKQYDKLHLDFKNGILTEEQAIELSIGYKEKPEAPEKVTSENIDSTLDFLFDDEKQENLLREKTRQEKLLHDTIEQNKNLEEKLHAYEEKERMISFEESKKQYIKDKWKSHKSTRFKEFIYFILISMLTLAPLAIGLVLKNVEKFDSWINSLGNFQWFIWGTLILLFLIELLGRSYLFDKNKVKNGWVWLKILFSFQYRSYKNKKLNQYGEDYIKYVNG